MLPVLATIFSWDATNTADLYSTIQLFLADFTPFLLPIIALFIAVIVVVVLIKAVKH